MEEDFNINPLDLDGEWLRQAALYNQYAGLTARAIKTRDTCDLQKKIVLAQIYTEIKNKLETEGKKATEAALDALVKLDPRYEQTSKELIDAEEQVNLMEADKWSLEHKKKALEKLCDDRTAGFFMPSGCESKGHQDPNLRKEQLKEVDRGLREEMAKKRIARG
jgi:hypothetical protein